MSEPTLTDVLTAVRSLSGEMTQRFDAVQRRFDLTDERIQTVDRKVDTVHGIVRHVQREVQSTRIRLDILIDSYGEFRKEYLREHPGGGHA